MAFAPDSLKWRTETTTYSVLASGTRSGAVQLPGSGFRLREWGENPGFRGRRRYYLCSPSASDYVHGMCFLPWTVAGFGRWRANVPLTIPSKKLVPLGNLVSFWASYAAFLPGEYRIGQRGRFEVSEGGGEVNVCAGLKRCFRLETAIVTAICKESCWLLLQDLISQGGVDSSLIRWVEYDEVGPNGSQPD